MTFADRGAYRWIGPGRSGRRAMRGRHAAARGLRHLDRGRERCGVKLHIPGGAQASEVDSATRWAGDFGPLEGLHLVLKDGALKVLHLDCLARSLRYLGHFVRDRIAELGQTAVVTPVVEKLATHLLSGLLKVV